jgi:hypothetical protein
MGDPYLPPLGRVAAPDGRTYALIGADLLGPMSLHIQWRPTTAPPGSPWSRPRLTRLPYPAGDRFEPDLEWRDEAIVVSFDLQDNQRVRQCGLTPGRQRRVIDLTRDLRDSDGDGWTDLEEDVLGLDASNQDTDEDGVPDGEDSTPSFRPDAAQAQSEESRILERAVFAAFGTTASRWALLVNPSSPKVQLWGMSGPVIYDREKPTEAQSLCAGGVYVSWRIARRSADEAVVELTDWEGLLAAGGQEIRLRKIDGEWFAVAWQTTRVS